MSTKSININSRVTDRYIVLVGIILVFLAGNLHAARQVVDDPSIMYMGCNEAVLSGNVMKVHNCFSTQNQMKLTIEQLVKLLPQLQMQSPRNVQVKDKVIEGNIATVYVTGDAFSLNAGQHSPANGVITMVLEGDIWRISQEMWGPK